MSIVYGPPPVLEGETELQFRFNSLRRPQEHYILTEYHDGGALWRANVCLFGFRMHYEQQWEHIFINHLLVFKYYAKRTPAVYSV